MKKAIAILVCVLMMLFACAPCVLAAAAGAAITVANTAAAPGETVKVAVDIGNNLGFCYLKLCFSYDDGAMELVSVENGAVSDDGFLYTTKAIVWDSAEDATGAGTLCTFVFRIKENAAAADYPVTVRVSECFDYNENPVPISAVSGKLTVRKAAAAAAKLTAQNVAAAPGETVRVNVDIGGNPGFSCLKLAVSFASDALELVGIENGTVSADGFTAGHKTAVWETANANGNGTLCTFVFKVREGASAGKYALSMNVPECFDLAGNAVRVTAADAAITVNKPAVLPELPGDDDTGAAKPAETPAGSPWLPGDVDNSGSVTAADARLTLRAAVKLESFWKDAASLKYKAAEIDRSGSITAADARIILRIAVKLESAENYK